MTGQALIKAAEDKLQGENRPKNIRLLAFQAMRHLPAKRIQPILDGLRTGLTRRQAAGLAGMSLTELNFVLKLGEQGHPAWTELVDALRVADAQSLAPAMGKLKEQAEDGVREARNTFLKAKDPDFRESQDPIKGTGINVGGMTFNLRTNFDPVEDDTVIDTDFEELNE